MKSTLKTEILAGISTFLACFYIIIVNPTILSQAGIPFVIIRSCSDNANNHARVNFNQFVGPASVNSAHLVLGILEEM